MKKKAQKEETPDLKKYFDKENYSTIIVGKEEAVEESAKDKVTTLIQLLSSKENRDFKHDTLKILKENNALDLVMKAITKAKNPLIKQNLIAACWEAELNCSPQLSFFVDLAVNGELNTCIEAMTVVQEMHGPFEPQLIEQELKKVEDAMKQFGKEDKGAMLEQLQHVLQGFAQA